jgi:transcriptional regulator with XRE-family HTH domain
MCVELTIAIHSGYPEVVMKHEREEDEGFNHLGEWLPPLLAANNLSVEELANETGLTRASIYFYLTDQTRPTEENMVRICHALGVPLIEGLKQYTPRKRGPKFGSERGRRSLSVRSRS